MRLFDISVSSSYDWGLTVGEEARKTWKQKLLSGFWDKYCSGKGLDIGYAGYIPDVTPILPSALGIDLNTPGYNGRTLPFTDNSQDYVYSSHFLEHVADYKNMIQEMFRVTKKGGNIIIVIPHKYLYERKETLPSKWNEDHKRFYTPASLLKEIEESLTPNTYRVRHMCDNDKDHIYGVPVEIHASGCYELEIVLEKL